MSEQKSNINCFDVLELFGEHDHSNASNGCERSFDLRELVGRRRKKTGTMLMAQRIHPLNQFNSNWDPSEEEFTLHFSKLEKFKANHGYMYIGNEVEDDEQFHSLKHWTKLIRRTYKRFSKEQYQKLLTHARVMMLDDIGFQWTIDAGKCNR